MTNVIKFPSREPKVDKIAIVNINDLFSYEVDLEKRTIKTHINNHVAGERTATQEEVAMSAAMFSQQILYREAMEKLEPWRIWDNFFFTPTREGFPDDKNLATKTTMAEAYPPGGWFIFARTVQSLVLEMRSKLPDNLKLWALKRDNDDYIEYQLRMEDSVFEPVKFKFNPAEANDDGIVVEFNISHQGKMLNASPWYISVHQDYTQVAGALATLMHQGYRPGYIENQEKGPAFHCRYRTESK